MIAAKSHIRQKVSRDPGPAANACKHGMTANRFVPADQDDRRRTILADLVATHSPCSREESYCIEELALALARLYDIERAAWERFEWEKSHASERHQRQLNDQFVKDLTSWRANPFTWQSVFSNTYLGAAHLARIWAEIADTLADSSGACSLEFIRDAIASQSSDFEADRICLEGRWIMQRHLVTVTEPEAEIERWIEFSRTDHKALESELRFCAHRLLAHAPDPKTARQELANKAIMERDRWTLRANDLRPRYETDLALAASMAVGLVPSDERATRESRLALRYLTSARNRVERLERKFEAIRKFSPIHNHRNKSTTTSTPPQTRSDSTWMIAGIERMEAEIAALDAEIAESETRSAALDAEIAAMEAEFAAEDAKASRLVPELPEVPTEPASRKLPNEEISVPAAPRPLRRPNPSAIAKSYRQRKHKH